MIVSCIIFIQRRKPSFAFLFYFNDFLINKMDADLFLIYFYSKHMLTYIVAQKALKVNVRQMFFFS